MLTQDQLWQNISNLLGRELKTLRYGHPFEVSEVEQAQVILLPVVSGKPRTIKRDTLEEAFCALLDRRELTGMEIADEFSPYNSVYIAALLASLPDVAVSSRPTRLIFMGRQLFYLD